MMGHCHHLTLPHPDAVMVPGRKYIEASTMVIDAIVRVF
jgi:hypothetical protein